MFSFRRVRLITCIPICISSFLAGCDTTAVVVPTLAESKSSSSTPMYELRVTVDSNGRPLRFLPVRTNSKVRNVTEVAESTEGSKLSAPPLAIASSGLANTLSRFGEHLTVKYYLGSNSKKPEDSRFGGLGLARDDAALMPQNMLASLQMSPDPIEDWEIQYPIAWESEDSWETLYGATGAEAVQDKIIVGSTASTSAVLSFGVDLIDDDETVYDTLTFLGGGANIELPPQGLHSMSTAVGKGLGFVAMRLSQMDEDDPCQDEKEDLWLSIGVETVALAVMVGTALTPGVGWLAFSGAYAAWVASDVTNQIMMKRLNRCRARNA